MVEPLLQVMGAAHHHLGGLGAGALAKLATNTLLGMQVTALAELIGLLQHNGADVAKTLAAVASTLLNADWRQPLRLGISCSSCSSLKQQVL